MNLFEEKMNKIKNNNKLFANEILGKRESPVRQVKGGNKNYNNLMNSMNSVSSSNNNPLLNSKEEKAFRAQNIRNLNESIPFGYNNMEEEQDEDDDNNNNCKPNINERNERNEGVDFGKHNYNNRKVDDMTNNDNNADNNDNNDDDNEDLREKEMKLIYKEQKNIDYKLRYEVIIYCNIYRNS